MIDVTRGLYQPTHLLSARRCFILFFFAFLTRQVKKRWNRKGLPELNGLAPSIVTRPDEMDERRSLSRVEKDPGARNQIKQAKNK